MKKNLIIILVSILIIIGLTILILNYCIPKSTKTTEYSTEQEQTNDIVPDNYIAVFNGGIGEKTYSTYIYKIENGQTNAGFSYINTENIVVSYGSSDLKIKITGQGEVQWTDNVFEVAKNNGAYSYVKVPNDEKSYTIEEFQQMFLRN